MAELTAVSGLVNVNDVSSDIITDNRKEFKDVDINKGNLYAAKALFSNIQLGWELPGTDDKFAESGSALDSTRIETLVVELARMNLELGLKKKGMERRSQLLDDDVPVSYDDGGTSMIKSFYNEFVKGTSDAALEELPGKVIMLTTTENMADELGESIVVVAIAQSIQINTNAAADKDWLQNGEFDGVDLNGYSSASSEEAKLYQKAMMESGYGYREYDGNKPGFVRFAKLPKLEPPSPTSTNRLETFYPGYDKILSTQKVVAWLRKNPTTGEWHIERLDYVD